MREPKIPPMKIKVQHTIRIKGVGRTAFFAILVAGGIQAINQQMNKVVKDHKDDIVDAAERFGKKVGDEEFGDRMKDVFDSAMPKDKPKGDTE